VKNIFLIIALSLSLLSCKQKPTEINSTQAKQKVITKRSFLIGDWAICGELFFQPDGQHVTMSRNICPQISFTDKGTGYVKMGDGPIMFDFSWAIKNDMMFINHPKNKNETFLDAWVYKIIYHNKAVFNEVALFDATKGIEYILNR
jgi:hypothetical protein